MFSAIQLSLILGLVLLAGAALLVETHGHGEKEEIKEKRSRRQHP